MTAGTDALAEIARLEMARVYGTPCPEHRQPVERPLASCFGPAPAATIQDLVDAVSPVAVVRSIPKPRRDAVEIAIARGHAPEQIAAELDMPLAEVHRIYGDMDRATA